MNDKPLTDPEMLDFIESNEAWLTYASAQENTPKAWRCYVAPRHYSTPDRRERAEKIGYGESARAAVVDAMVSTIVPYFPPQKQ